jgi:hypothetical protein
VAFSRLGDLFLIDSENTRIMKVDRSNNVERTFGGIDAGKGRLQNPTRIEVGPKDNVFVVDGHRIVIFDAFGNYLGLLYPDLFAAPSGICGDPAGISVADKGMVYTFDADNRPLWSLHVDSLPGLRGVRIEDIAVTGTTVHLLTKSGVVRTEAAGCLDKEENSK